MGLRSCAYLCIRLGVSKSTDIARLQAELADVQQARRMVLRNGQSYKIAGSTDTVMPQLAELRAEEKRIKSEILSLVISGPASNYASFH